MDGWFLSKPTREFCTSSNIVGWNYKCRLSVKSPVSSSDEIDSEIVKASMTNFCEIWELYIRMTRRSKFISVFESFDLNSLKPFAISKLNFNMKFLLAILTVSAVCSGTFACIRKFNNEKQMSEAVTACVAELEAGSAPNYALFNEESFDDKCVSRCVLKKLEILDEAGNLDRDGAFDMLEERAPKQLVNKLTESMSKCADSAGVMKIEGTDKCKPLAQFYGCFVVAADMLC